MVIKYSVQGSVKKHFTRFQFYTRVCFVALSAHTPSVLDEKGGQQSHAANPQHSLSLNNKLTNSDSLVEFFIHRCEFLKCSASFNFNQIKFLLSPKIHDYSLNGCMRPPALGAHAKAAPGWLAQRSLSHQSRRAYLNLRTLGGNKANMAKQQEKSIISQATPYQPLSAPPTYRSGIFRPSTYQPTGCQHNCHYTLTVSASTIKSQPLRPHMST